MIAPEDRAVLERCIRLLDGMQYAWGYRQPSRPTVRACAACRRLLRERRRASA